MSKDLNIEKTLEDVKKTVSTPAYTNPATLTLVRENLSGFINRLTEKETPVRDRLMRKSGAGLAASWNVLTAMGVGASPFAEGGTPTESATTYARRSAIYKELGAKKSVTDKMLAAGRSFVDVEAELTEVAIREVIQDEENLILNGDATGSPLQFDGLASYITTNITDDGNDALGFRTELIETEVANLVNNYGVRPTAIYVSWGMQKAINESLAGDVRVNLDQTNQVSSGVQVGFIQTMIGKLPIIPTFAIADDSATYAGNTVSDIYIVTEKARGNDVLYLEDLYPLGKSMLDRTGAAINFMVTECTVLVCRAEEFQAVVQNVRIA